MQMVLEQAMSVETSMVEVHYLPHPNFIQGNYPFV